MHQAHNAIDGSPHVVGRETPDEGIEFGRRWTDSQEEGNLDEDEYQGGDAMSHVSQSLEGFSLQDRRHDKVIFNGLQAYYAENENLEIEQVRYANRKA